jgi:predicted methyltransferase
MPTSDNIDLREAVNAISDVIVNRPRPIRQLDQIYMKAGDMVLQSEFVARWAQGKRLAFIGDGDAISVCVAYLHKRNIIAYGPSAITVFDFDERICNAVTRFAEKEGLSSLSSCLYNCFDPFPETEKFDCFYTNPPWGASNNGESVKVFTQRGMEANGYGGEGTVVIADDSELEWPQRVLSEVQGFCLENGYFTQKMMARVHSYHLDDAPELRSCNLILKALPNNSHRHRPSEPIVTEKRLQNFYGKDSLPRVKYVRERKTLNYGHALDEEYELELLGGHP